jgi:sigma-B regulation protein RsbU (phosphoserine phosphatase)
MHLNLVWERCSGLLDAPAAFASAVNNELARAFGGDVSFATAVCGKIDASNGRLQLAGAGGPSPLVIRRSGDIQTVTLSGLPLGVLEDADYGGRDLRLEAGDALLLFTDGAFEIDNADNKILGVDGLVGLLTAMDYPRTPLSMPALEERLLKFSNAIRLADDMTIIEARFVGPG